MSTQLARRIRESSGLSQNGLRVPREVERAVDTAGHRGLVSAARVQAAGYVTHVALEHTAMLTGEEELLGRLHPLGEARFQVIVDRFVGAAAAEIARLGF